MEWNLANLFELAADTVPGRLALAHGTDGTTRSWAEFDRRCDALARHLHRRYPPGTKLALYAPNRPEYLEAFAAALKARISPVNVNYRYREDELVYLLDNSDAAVVVYEHDFADRVRRIRARLPDVREWIEFGAESLRNPFALPYEEIAREPASRLDLPRSAGDLILLYTGGTTGMPKGVMWEQGALWRALGGGGSAVTGERPSESVEEHRERIADEGRAQRLIPGSPLMHGTGLFTALGALANGGTAITLEKPSFDAEELWNTVEARRANAISIVGDAFGRPMARALEQEPDRWDLSCCRLIISSGTMWSPEIKQILLRHLPDAVLFDSFGSSEALGFGIEITTRESRVEVAKFRLGPNCKVFTPDGREVEPGSGEAGYVARSGPIPLGYYGDEEKTASTFKTIGGRRWSIPGDWCTVNEDGTLNLLGRGSVCINTGGEKVYPEEVEEVLKTHPSVRDAVVVGLPDERWGEAVTGLVELEPGAAADEATLRGWVRERLAPYKCPKRLVFVENVGRAPSGKADYQGARKRALEALGFNPSSRSADQRGADPIR